MAKNHTVSLEDFESFTASYVAAGQSGVKKMIMHSDPISREFTFEVFCLKTGETFLFGGLEEAIAKYNELQS